MLDRIAFCITAFQRPKLVARLVQSITRRYPNARIYIADDSQPEDRFVTDQAHQVKYLPFDQGLSAKRNRLVEMTSEKYLLFLEDDFVFTYQTDIGKLYTLLKGHPDYGLFAGVDRRNGQLQNHASNFQVRGNHLALKVQRDADRSYQGIPYRRVDFAANFFLARRVLFSDVLWNEAYKMADHWQFFWDLKNATGWKVGVTPDVVVDHKPEAPGEYQEYRRRAGLMNMSSLKDYGFRSMGKE